MFYYDVDVDDKF